MPDTPEEPTVARLAESASGDSAERDLATRYAPILLLDADEPFQPVAAGYTVFRERARSPSAHRYVEMTRPGNSTADTIIEYAIWWDWDIGHLYELEHIWVYLDANGEVIHAEGSRHGRYREMLVDGQPPTTGERVTLYSESGKHGFAPELRWLERIAPVTKKLCTRHAGLEGLLITWLYRGIIRVKTPETDRLVHTHLERYAFEPTLDFRHAYPIRPESLVPWQALFAWIPRRVGWWVGRLRDTIPVEQRRLLRIAQRGAAAHAPENTRAAIIKAAEQGADVVMLDVQQSADGVPIIVHGADLSRTTDGTGSASQLTLDKLKTLDAGDGQRVPTLEEAIALCREQHLGLYLELETAEVVRPVVEAIRRHNLYDRAAVCSDHPEWLVGVKALDRKIQTALILPSPGVDAIGLARAVGAEYIHPIWEGGPAEIEKLLTPGWLREVRAAGLGIICGHEGGVCDLPALRRYGVDAISTSAPHLLRPRLG